MRRAPAIALAAALAGCSESSPPPEPAAPPREHPLAQDGSADREITARPDRARIQLDLSVVRQSIKLYRGANGGPPGSIAELAVEGLHYPADLEYDPATGTVRSMTYPGL